MDPVIFQWCFTTDLNVFGVPNSDGRFDLQMGIVMCNNCETFCLFKSQFHVSELLPEVGEKTMRLQKPRCIYFLS